MQEFVEKFAEYGYLILFLYSLGGGMLALAALAAFSTSLSQLSPQIAIITASTANFLGAMALFYLCKCNKNEFASQLAQHRRKIALLVLYFRKSGFLLTLVCKFLYGFKTIAPLAAELAKLSLVRFAIYNALSSAIWSVVVFWVAYFASDFIRSQIAVVNNFYLLAIFLLALILLIIFISKKSKKRKKSENA